MSWHHAKKTEYTFCEIVEIVDDIVYRTGDPDMYTFDQFYYIDPDELEVPLI